MFPYMLPIGPLRGRILEDLQIGELKDDSAEEIAAAAMAAAARAAIGTEVGTSAFVAHCDAQILRSASALLRHTFKLLRTPIFPPLPYSQQIVVSHVFYGLGISPDFPYRLPIGP